jgi:hypothetical protein
MATESTVDRRIPLWLRTFARLEGNDRMAHIMSMVVQDGVNDYARAVLTDGLLLLEFRDAIHEGDGNRIETCYKFLLPYFFATNHTKYALECFRFLCAVSTTCFGPELAAQVKWGRFVNNHGKIGRNVPVDFQMEHLNKLLKRLILGLGANVTEDSMVVISRCINRLQHVTSTLDVELNITPEQSRHTRAADDEDERLILHELVHKSSTFRSIPGRQHRSQSFNQLKPSIMEEINPDRLVQWINKQKNKLINDILFKETLKK